MADIRNRKEKPDDKLVAALETLLRKVYGHFDVPMVAEVPIARWKAKLTPIVHGPEQEKADLFRGEDLGKKSNRRIFGQDRNTYERPGRAESARFAGAGAARLPGLLLLGVESGYT